MRGVSTPYVVTLHSTTYIIMGERFSLRRVVDGKTEASGFFSAAEAKQYVIEQGHTLAV